VPAPFDIRPWTPVFVLLLLASMLATDFALVEHGRWEPHHVLGLALAIPGYAGWATARYQLGTAFTARAEARRLVTHGVYARVRHPVYLFAEILTAGVFLFIGHPELLVLSVLLLPLQIKRARREERVLEAAFGEQYRSYRKRTWF
jgi:protein-S-isoprenylcysteine O-methyltransferase Ste14